MFLISLFQASTASLQFIWINNRTRIYDVAWTKWLGASTIQERYQVTCSNSWLIFSAFSSVCYAFTMPLLQWFPPSAMWQIWIHRACRALHRWLSSNSCTQQPSVANVYQRDILLYWLADRDRTLTMSYYNHLQSAYRHATIYGHDATEQTCYVIHVKSVSEKFTCSYTSANKNKKTKNKHDLSQPLVEMYSIALPTGRPPIYNRIHNKVAWTTQAKCGFGGTVFDALASTKFSKPAGLCEIKLTNHWSLEE